MFLRRKASTLVADLSQSLVSNRVVSERRLPALQRLGGSCHRQCLVNLRRKAV